MLPLSLAAIWLVGAWLRVYRQAQFYQIEEYMSRRYLRWWLGERRRALPPRPLLAWFVGLMLCLALAGNSSEWLPYAIVCAAAIAAVIPAPRRESKKPLSLTSRVKRLLFGAGLVTLLAHLFPQLWIASAGGLDGTLAAPIQATAGLLGFLLAPLWLVAGNALMQPLEATLRRRYLRRAERVLAAIQPKIIGITGSYGKTTTKHFLRDILSLRYQTYATPKSYNTLMGVSLAINRDLAEDYRTEVFICEMGAYVEGEIARICQLARPEIAIVTEVGPQHLERFGSLENVKRAKYELIERLPPDGVAIFNWDNPYIRDMTARGYPATRLTVSRQLSPERARQQGIDWIATGISESLEGLAFTATHLPSGEQARVSASVIGEHNVSNLLLCIAAAQHEGVPLGDIARRVRSLQPAESRLARETTAGGVTIINDAYSANPAGVVSALKVLGMHDGGARLLITPGLVELGELQAEENRKLGALAAEVATDIILVGAAQTKPIHEAVIAARFDPERVRVVETLAEAVAWYRERLGAGDAVLFLNDLPDTY